MTSNQIYKQKYITIIKVSLIFLLLLYPVSLKAQSPADFSGNWEFNKTASSPDLIESNYDGTVILQITQDSAKIAFVQIWKKEGNSDFTTAADTYNLDGIERIEKHSVGTSKRSAKWSQDKQALTITVIDTQTLKKVLQDFLVKETYYLSDDGMTLTNERYSKNPVTGETTVKEVYQKK